MVSNLGRESDLKATRYLQSAAILDRKAAVCLHVQSVCQIWIDASSVTKEKMVANPCVTFRRKYQRTRYCNRSGGVPNMFWNSIQPLVDQVKVFSTPGNKPVSLSDLPKELELVGVGTDAAVLRHVSFPDVVFKVFAEGRKKVLQDEWQVYRRLKGLPFFPVCYGVSDNFLVLSFEPGITMYDCLVKGVPITEEVLDQVEQVRKEVRNRGLNPRDIHLKNIILQEGRVKLVDVSEYMKPGDDHRWDDLVQAYQLFYSMIPGKKLPVQLVEQIKEAYLNHEGGSFSIFEFGRRFIHLLKPGNHQVNP